jgi:hypothetical protein
MPVITRSPRSRPHSAPAYYLGRPASVWITALHRQPPAAPERPAGSGTTCQPERTTR